MPCEPSCCSADSVRRQSIDAHRRPAPVLVPFLGPFNRLYFASLRPASCYAYVRCQSSSERLADDLRCAMRMLGFSTHTRWLDRLRSGKYADWTKRSLPKACTGLRAVRKWEDRIEGLALHRVKHSTHVKPCVQPGTPTVRALS
jgi:hypothetical protein